jgi:hypothetical protein
MVPKNEKLVFHSSKILENNVPFFSKFSQYQPFLNSLKTIFSGWKMVTHSLDHKSTGCQPILSKFSPFYPIYSKISNVTTYDTENLPFRVLMMSEPATLISVVKHIYFHTFSVATPNFHGLLIEFMFS